MSKYSSRPVDARTCRPWTPVALLPEVTLCLCIVGVGTLGRDLIPDSVGTELRLTSRPVPVSVALLDIEWLEMLEVVDPNRLIELILLTGVDAPIDCAEF